MLNIKLIKRGTEGELQFSGRLDTTSVNEADKVLTDTVARFDTLILDLENLEYISSAGLRILKRARMGMERKKGTLEVRNVSKPVMRVFALTGFTGLLELT